jgi:hypothetical protein
MKKLLALTCSLLIASFSLQAQDKDKDKDKVHEQIKEKKQDQDKVREQDREKVQEPEHLMMMDGEMYQVGVNKQEKVKEPLKLHNGMMINPDGSLMMKDQKMERMKNGECMDMEGNRYESKERFHEKMEHRMKDRIHMDKDREKNKPEMHNKK